MRNLLNPRWLLIVNTLPLALMFLIFYGHYSIIHTQLEPENLYYWKLFSTWIFVLGGLNLAYTATLIVLKKKISMWYSVLALVGYISFLYVYIYNSNEVIPLRIPQWMVPDGAFLSVGAFVMPTLMHALLVLVGQLTRETEKHRAWVSFLISLAVPTLWYLFVQLVMRPLDWFDHDMIGIHVTVTLIALGTVVFLFFLIRSIYILISKKGKNWGRYSLVWKIPVAIVFPLLGLAINNGHIDGDMASEGSGIIGSFSGYWFYILALVNGILVCLPSLENRMYRLLLFIGRSITLAFTTYFFVVFLPFLPLSVIAIVAAGLGFLMLTPLVLMVIHVNEMAKDFAFLQPYYSKNELLTLSAVGFLVIPAVITFNFMNHKTNLHHALDYVYASEYDDQTQVDAVSLSKTLSIIKYQKRGRRFSSNFNHLPYITPFFNWLVLDNLMLSEYKIELLEQVFMDGERRPGTSDVINNSNVYISEVGTTSTYDSEQEAWVSWIDLEITNGSGSSWNAEYATTLNLPPGTYISDYYLYVGEEKEMGILAEKKSAMWIFSQIRNVRRDPGILYYLGGNRVGFRVFPFQADEVRRTGIELIHKEPITFTIDKEVLQLGEYSTQAAVSSVSAGAGNVYYISAREKTTLDTVQRQPYYHFIVDISADADSSKGSYQNSVQHLLDRNLIPLDNAKVTFANTYLNTVDFSSNWYQQLNDLEYTGGFYMERAIKNVLVEAYEAKENNYPVIVVLTEDNWNAVMDGNFADLKMAFPESDYFYMLEGEGQLVKHSLVEKPINHQGIVDTPQLYHAVLAWPDAQNVQAYLPNDSMASVVVTDFEALTEQKDMRENKWEDALLMEGMWREQVFHPRNGDEKWFNLVKASFQAQVMTPVTSYIVLENEAQRKVLVKKQEDVLSGKRSLDLMEDPKRMSEPGLWLLVLVISFAWGVRWVWLRSG